jgi:hypothetical protein
VSQLSLIVLFVDSGSLFGIVVVVSVSNNDCWIVLVFCHESCCCLDIACPCMNCSGKFGFPLFAGMTRFPSVGCVGPYENSGFRNLKLVCGLNYNLEC